MTGLLAKVEKELHNVAERGITSSNLDSTYKLIDIYKDIKESEYYIEKTKKYKEAKFDEKESSWHGSSHIERYLNRLREGYVMYNEGSEDSMLKGIEQIMSTICILIEELVDYAKTQEEKELINKHIKNIHNV